MNKTETRYFLAGIVCGEGCFSHYVRNDTKYPVWRFELNMHMRDLEVLNLLQQELGCGLVKIYPSKPTMARLEIIGQKDLVEKVIPYFDGYLVGYKAIQFEAWKQALLRYWKDRFQRKVRGGHKALETFLRRVNLLDSETDTRPNSTPHSSE